MVEGRVGLERPGKLVCIRARGARVLVVDDDVMVRTVTVALLEQMGCHCEGVATGAEASARVARGGAGEHAIDLVLLDQQLWQETGEGVCRRLRGEGLDAPIVAMSGDGFALDGRLRDAGFDAGIQKPFSALELHACVELHVGRKHGGAVETA